MVKISEEKAGPLKKKPAKKSAAQKEPELSPEQQYLKLVEEATKEDPFREPIKDLIDHYADISDKMAPPIVVQSGNRTAGNSTTEKVVEARIKEKLGIENRNNYGNKKANITSVVDKKQAK